MFCKPAYELVYSNLNARPFNYLEIGVFDGDSIGGIAKNHPEYKIYGIDPFLEDGYTVDHTRVNANEHMPVQQANTYKNIQGLTNVVLFETTSKDFADTLTDKMVNDMNVGWVLIDGSHHYEDVIIDINLAIRLIGHKPGVIIFDDVNIEGVNKAYLEFLNMSIKKSDAVDIYAAHPGHILFHKVNEQTTNYKEIK